MSSDDIAFISIEFYLADIFRDERDSHEPRLIFVKDTDHLPGVCLW